MSITTTMESHDTELTPRRLLAVLRRRAPVVAVCLVVAVAASLGYSLSARKMYTATTSVLFNDTPLSQQVAGLQAVPNSSQQSQQDTNVQLLKIGDLAQQTAQRVGHGLTKKAVAGSVSITPQGDTTVVEVSSTLGSPALAAQVANTYAHVFVNEQENSNHRYYQAALATVEQQIAKLSRSQASGVQGLALQNRAQSLATLAQLHNGTVSLAQAATLPTGASSPLVKRNVILAALLGLLLGGALAAGLERFDQTLHEPEELEEIYGLPLLGVVTEDPAFRRRSEGRRGGKEAARAADAFQFVRARLRYFNVDRELRTLMIVSAQPGDGKTTVAHWLADATAALGSKVVLIEADLRRPTLAEELGVQAGPGLTDALIGARPLEVVVQTAKLVRDQEGGGDQQRLDVVVAGALPPNPAEMLESGAMSQVLEQAKAQYDFVVLDTAPLGVVSDCLPLLRIVDGVAVVAGLAQGRRDAGRRLAATLRSVDAPLLGVIANHAKTRGGLSYGYGYGYTSNPDLPKLADDARPIAPAPPTSPKPRNETPGFGGLAPETPSAVAPPGTPPRIAPPQARRPRSFRRLVAGRRFTRDS